jgi:hypothetical protein
MDRKRKVRIWIWAAVAGIAALWLFWPGPRTDWQTYRKIENGVTRSQVRAILGTGPTRVERAKDCWDMPMYLQTKGRDHASWV